MCCTYGKLVFNASGIEEWPDFLPQFPPRPGAQFEVSAEIPLYDLQSQTLLLKGLEVLTGKVTAHVSLHPGDDLAKTFVTELFHLTQDSGTEEYLSMSSSRYSIIIHPYSRAPLPTQQLYNFSFCLLDDSLIDQIQNLKKEKKTTTTTTTT
jgi:hypothetical protein